MKNVAEGRQGGPPDDWLTVVAMGTVATFPRARRRSARANTVVSRDRSCVVAPLGGQFVTVATRTELSAWDGVSRRASTRVWGRR